MNNDKTTLTRAVKRDDNGNLADGIPVNSVFKGESLLSAVEYADSTFIVSISRISAMLMDASYCHLSGPCRVPWKATPVGKKAAISIGRLPVRLTRQVEKVYQAPKAQLA